TIDVFAAAAIAEQRSTALYQDQRLMLGSAPFAHIRERVPDKPLVCVNQFVRVPLGHGRRISNLIFSRIKPRRSFSEGGPASVSASVFQSFIALLLHD